MHSVQRSPGRVLFEVFCALAVSASFVGAWQQSGASALVPAAAVAALYSVVRLFDLRGRKREAAMEPERVSVPHRQPDVPASPGVAAPAPVVEQRREPPAYEAPSVSLPVADQQAMIRKAMQEPATVEPKAARASAGGRTKAPKKTAARRPKASKETKATEPAPSSQPEVVVEPATVPETGHVQLAPLFEPEPFVRQPRAFGRKARFGR